MAGRGDLQSLVRQASEGDSKAWGNVYEVMAPSVYRLCRRLLPTREDAEDAAGEVFLKARLRLSQYDPSRPFAPWLYRVAANHCWDELRKKGSRVELEDSEQELVRLADEAPSPQEAVLANENRDAVRRAVRELDDRSRTALALRYYADMSYQEIGEVLGLSPTFVGVVLLRARRKLRERLDKRGSP